MWAPYVAKCRASTAAPTQAPGARAEAPEPSQAPGYNLRSDAGAGGLNLAASGVCDANGDARGVRGEQASTREDAMLRFSGAKLQIVLRKTEDATAALGHDLDGCLWEMSEVHLQLSSPPGVEPG